VGAGVALNARYVRAGFGELTDDGFCRFRGHVLADRHARGRHEYRDGHERGDDQEPGNQQPHG
jgi:hypothetical protein